MVSLSMSSVNYHPKFQLKFRLERERETKTKCAYWHIAHFISLHTTQPPHLLTLHPLILLPYIYPHWTTHITLSHASATIPYYNTNKPPNFSQWHKPTQPKPASTMDWYSWLSKTALEPSLIYEYGLALSRNELQREDLAYFNHEFLQSMGISVAKHRLEILKLARKEVGEPPNSLSKLILAIAKTKKRFNKYVNKLVHHHDNSSSNNNNAMIKPLPEPVRPKEQWKGTLTRKCKSEKEVRVEQPVVMMRSRKVAKSGPLDYRGQDKNLLVPPRSLKLSGPLDRKMQEKLVFNYRSPISSGPIDMAMAQERLMLTNRSPRLSGPLNHVRPPSPKFIHGDYNKEKTGGGGEDYGDQTLWETLFQDMKPT